MIDFSGLSAKGQAQKAVLDAMSKPSQGTTNAAEQIVDSFSEFFFAVTGIPAQESKRDEVVDYVARTIEFEQQKAQDEAQAVTMDTQWRGVGDYADEFAEPCR